MKRQPLLLLLGALCIIIACSVIFFEEKEPLKNDRPDPQEPTSTYDSETPRSSPSYRLEDNISIPSER